MTRRVVFVGGPQTRTLARAYRSEVAFDSDDEIAFIGTDALIREGALRVIARADQLILETGEQGDAVAAGLLPPDGEVIRVPAVDADFLWPFAGSPHPRQTTPDGPYPAEHGDAYLDRLMQEGLDGEEAVLRYLALDIGQEAGLDLMLARRLKLQTGLDRLTGQDIAGFIGQHFRTISLFASRPRPRLKLFRYIAATLFERLGAPPEAAGRLRLAAVANNSQPIHPGVLAHFGMAVPEPGHRYRMQDEGRFTFEEYCRRYLAYEWNETLHRGMALARSDPAQAIGLLREGLERSPNSRAGRRALNAALDATGATPDPALAEPERTPVLVSRRAPAPEQLPALVPVPVPYPEEEPGHAHAGVFAQQMRAEAAPRGYVELPPPGALPELEAPRPSPALYEPLPPSHELIEVLPGLLQQGDSLAHTLSGPFSSMPEAMPPPPLHLVLPPELQEEQPRRGFFARLAEFLTG